MTSLAIVAMSLMDLRQPLGQLRSDIVVGILIAISVGLLVVDVVSDVDLSGFNTRMGPSPLWLALSVLSPVVVVRRLL